MNALARLLIIVIISAIAVFGILPGCDELVTQENFYYDTIHLVENFYYDTITFNTYDSACVEFCHSDTTDSVRIISRQWENSGHASRNMTGILVDCFTCHAPHTTLDFTLRDSAELILANGQTYNYQKSNQCAQCHKFQKFWENLDTLVVEDNWIQWALNEMPQAENFMGTGGYEYSDRVYDNSHRGIVTTGCLHCHMENIDGFDLGGHSLNIENGSDYPLASCIGDGCHSNAFDADSVIIRQTLHTSLLNFLGNKLVAAGLADSLDDSTILPLTMLMPIDTGDIGALGALYNYFYVKNDKSRGMHDFVYDTALIRSSTAYLDTAYIPQ